MTYIIDTGWFDEGGSCQFYPIVGQKNKAFKEFKSKKYAKEALRTQKLLNKYSLAPAVYSDIIKLPYKNISNLMSEYGFITQIAKPFVLRPIKKQRIKDHKILSKIQNLVDDIKKYAKLNFWDCHQYNIGLINKRPVCIDTGPESFDPLSDFWGLGKPGPKCSYCLEYRCRC
jgi:hypothetical protein